MPLTLIATFYSFNMHYPQGCTNFYSFFEYHFYGKKKTKKKTRQLSSMLARIENSELKYSMFYNYYHIPLLYFANK